MFRLPRALVLLAVCGLCLAGAGAARADLNDLIVEALQGMPAGGNYAVTKSAFDGLNRSISVRGDGLEVSPEAAQPSFCSGATYLVFVQVIQRLQREGALHLDRETLALLPVVGQRDGQGIWGRWNANGPGTARLFAELRLGPNFTDFAQARPGDFMKVFWTAEIGKKEHGHSVIYLGTVQTGGQEFVQFWSSNLPATKGDNSGYGRKLVARSKMARVIFSRLENPQNLALIRSVPKVDPFLASLLSRSVDFAEVRRQCGL